MRPSFSPRRLRLLVLTVAVFCGLSVLPALGQSGQLDTGFGGTGNGMVVFNNLNNGASNCNTMQAYDVAVQPGDQKLLVPVALCGPAALLRLNPDGSLDNSFGLHGVASFNIAVPGTNLSLIVGHVVLQPDGKILATATGRVPGQNSQYLALIRLNPDGSLDTTFGDSSGGAQLGYTLFLGGGFINTANLVLQPDGNIVVGGSDSNGNAANWFVSRYTASGILDVSFGTAGVTEINRPGCSRTNCNDYGESVALQPADGKIVITGSVSGPSGSSIDTGVARLNTDGSLDTSFGTNGIAIFQPGASPNPNLLYPPVGDTSLLNDSPYKIAVQPNGEIIVAGAVGDFISAQFTNPNRLLMLLGITANGTLDSNFGSGGIVLSDYPGGGNTLGSPTWGTDMVLLPDGRIAVSAMMRGAFSVVLYQSNGSLDTNFGTSATPGFGQLVRNYGSYNYPVGLAIQANGDFVMAGGVNITTPSGALVARYGAAEPPPPPSVTVTGLVANDKTYDGTTAATIGGTPALAGVSAGDSANVSVTCAATGTFAQADAGSGIAVTLAAPGCALSGSAAGNYTLTQPALSAAIAPAAQTITFPTLASTATVDSTVALGATSSSGNVSYSLSGVPALLDGGSITFTNIGNVTITVSAAASTDYLAAGPVSQSVTVNPAANSDTAPVTAVGSSTTQAAVINITTAGTLQNISVVTQGAPNLDFTAGTSSSPEACVSGQFYAAGQSCVVSYTFRPTSPGERLGGIVLKDSGGTVLGTSYLGGLAQAPLGLFTSLNPTWSVAGFNGPSGISTDGFGNVYIADAFNNELKTIPYSGGSATALASVGFDSGSSTAGATAVDGAGNLYVLSGPQNALYQMVNGSLVKIATVTSGDDNLEVDGSGNLYASNKNTAAMYKIAAGTHAVTTIFNGLGGARFVGMAVDPAGDLFAADIKNNALYELPVANQLPGGSGALIPLVRQDGNLSSPQGIALDAAGNIYVDGSHGTLLRYAAGTLSETTLPAPATGSLALDGQGNIYAANGANVVKYARITGPTDQLPTTAYGATSSVSASGLVEFENDGNAPLVISGYSAGTNFGTSGAGNTCAVGNLDAGKTCFIGASFAPVATGSLSGALVLTDNNLNQPNALQSVGLDGTSTPAALTITASSSSLTYGSAVPAITPTFSGFVNGDTAASLATAPVCTTGATSASNVGSYATTCTGAVDSNYTISYLNGAIAIAPATLVLTFPALASPVAVNATATLNAAASDGETVTYTLSGAAAAIGGNNLTYTNAGLVTIIASVAGASSGNYVGGAPISQTVQVNPYPSSYTAAETAAGQATAPQVAYVNFSAGGTLASVGVVTQGATGLDFNPGGNDTCVAGQVYTAGQACEVDFTFRPKSPGEREGAIVLKDASGNILGTSFLGGLGDGPLGLFTSPTPTWTVSANVPRGLSFDGAGDAYWNDSHSFQLLEVPAGTSTVIPLGSTTSGFAAGATAIDGAGNVYMSASHQVSGGTVIGDLYEMVNGSGSLGRILTNLPAVGNNLVVDGSGNLYLSVANGAILEIAAGTHAVTTVYPGAGENFIGMAIDPAGDLFTANFNNNTLYELPAGASPRALHQLVSNDGHMNKPHSVALDAAGNVYVGNFGGGDPRILRYAAGTWQETTLPAAGRTALAVDGQGDIYAAADDQHITKYSRSTPPAVAFPATQYGASSVAPAVEFENAGNADLLITGYAASSSFGANGSGNTCATGTMDPGATCFIAATFVPAATGALTGTLTITDNNLNQSGTRQSVGLNGTGTPAPLAITAASASMTYGGAVPALTAAYSGLVNGDTAAAVTGQTCSTTATSTSPVGSYPSTCTGGTAANYTITYAPGTVTVGAAALTVTASSASITYGGAVPAITASYAGFVNGETPALVGGLTCSTTATASSPVGNYPSSCAGGTAANYTITYVPGTVAVGGAHLTVTASSASMTYGGAAPAVTAGYAGFVNGDSAAVISGQACSTTATSASPVGSYPSSCAGGTAANYTITYVPGTVAVGAATLTITASSATMTYGGAAPVVSAGYTGFANGDSSASLGSALVCSTTATSGSPVGRYPATCSGAADANYAISYAPGAVTVQPAPLTIVGLSYTRSYNTPNPAFAATFAGIVNQDAIGATFATAAGLTSAPGTYDIAITPTGAALSNYTVTVHDGSLTVDSAPQAITFPAVGDQIYNGTAFTVTLQAVASSGLPVTYAVSGPAVLSGNQLTIQGPGSVTVTASQAGNGGYLPAPDATQTFQTRLGFGFGFYATDTGCASMSLNGNVRVDSYDSSLGAFPAGQQPSGGNVGTNGTLTLDGRVAVLGALFDPHANQDENCDHSGQAALVVHGHDASVSGGIVQLPSALAYPTPAAPAVAPPSTPQFLADRCDRFAGCTQVGDHHVALAPGTYGDLTVDDNLTVDLSAGTYNLHSLHLQPGAVLNLVSGPVIVNLAGPRGEDGDALDLKAGTIRNNGRPADLAILYGGRADVELGGNNGHQDRCDSDHDRDDSGCTAPAALAAVVYAPNARVRLGSGLVFAGAIVGGTIDADGSITLHYDRSLAATAAFGGGTPPPPDTDRDHDGDNDHRGDGGYR